VIVSNDLRVDPSSKVPLHRQIYGGLRAAILSGRLSAGERLPATRALAGTLSISRTTVAEAYDQLQAEGYVEGRHGSGTYVVPGISPSSSVSETGCASDRLPKAGRRPRLSAWGRRAASDEYQALLRSPDPMAFRYDFRPHRIARDRFPWDAWRASVERALVADRAALMSYPPAAGQPDLRQAIAEHVARYRSVACSSDQIVIVNGIQQGLNLLAELLLDPGDRVAVEDPGYPAARLTFAARGLSVSRLPVDGDGLIVERLTKAGAHRIVHVTPSHQDPTGATLSLARRLALLDLAEHTRCLILEDDYDSEFRYEGKPVESLKGLDRAGLVIYAGTFSKSILPGLRIGFLVLPPDLVPAFVAAKSLWDSGAPILEQAALAQFIRCGEMERHIRRMRRLYRRRRDALIAGLTATFGGRVSIGERHGGLNVLVSFASAAPAGDIVRRAARLGVGLRSAAAYYAVAPERPTFLMGFAELSEEDARDGLAILASAMS
jgi:GntR family transcriptional regulator/MocR family aminotransferase